MQIKILQTDGLAVGIPTSSVVAEAYIQTWNTNVPNIIKTLNHKIFLDMWMISL
jgi:hypothetical protein